MISKKAFGMRYFILYSLIFFFVLSIITFSIVFVIQKNAHTSEFNEIMTHERQTIELEDKLLAGELTMLMSDLLFLTNVFRYEYNDHNYYDETIEHWREFSFQHGIYDQIRFIDQNGDEKIRINLANGESYSVPQDQLQNKADRYYFSETAKLPEGDIYVSPVDLNVENGLLEIPYKPMIRLSTPIFSSEGKFAGIIILNYLAGSTLETFRKIADESYGTIVLLNGNGDWISSGDVRRDWNFMFEGREELNFSWYFDEWDFIGEESGQEITETGLFSYSRVNLKDKLRSHDPDIINKVHLADGSWLIVSYLERDANPDILFVDKLLPLASDIFLNEIILFVAVLMISLVVGYLLYLYVKAYKKTKIYSEYDSLTKMLNRRAGTERLEALLSERERRQIDISLCFIDVNGLKQVNDILGHKMGDELLVSVAEIIQSSIREHDFVARMGGDEFIIVFAGIDRDRAENVWDRIYNEFEKINDTQNRAYTISVSHGIVSHKKSDPPITADTMIKQADALMYEQKRIIKKDLDVIRK